MYIFVKTWSTRRGSVGDVSAAAPDSLAAKYNATTTTDGDRREGVSSLQRQSSSQDRTRERNPLRGSPHRGVLGVGVKGAGGPLRTSVYNIACFRVSLCAHCNAHNVIKYNAHAECTLSNARVHFRYFWSLPPLCFFFFFSYILRSFRYIRLVRLCTPPRRYSFCLSKIGRARLPFLLSRPRRVFWRQQSAAVIMQHVRGKYSRRSLPIRAHPGTWFYSRILFTRTPCVTKTRKPHVDIAFTTSNPHDTRLAVHTLHTCQNRLAKTVIIVIKTHYSGLRGLRENDFRILSIAVFLVF